MRLLKQALAVLGTVTMIAVLVAVIAPNKVHAAIATLVQIVPGTVTQVGQNESQLVSLVCVTGNPYCDAVNNVGTTPATAYVVPSGYTLIVTDWSWKGNNGAAQGAFAENSLTNASGGVFVNSAALVTTTGNDTYAHEHYLTGIRVGSGITIADQLAAGGLASFSWVQGYLVPN